MPKPVFAIAIEPSADLQREQVHDFIKTHAEDWWHGMPDLWLVVGKTAEEWRDLLGSVFPTVGSGKLMVLKVDTSITAGGSWAYRALLPDSSKQWLQENFRQEETPELPSG